MEAEVSEEVYYTKTWRMTQAQVTSGLEVFLAASDNLSTTKYDFAGEGAEETIA